MELPADSDPVAAVLDAAARAVHLPGPERRAFVRNPAHGGRGRLYVEARRLAIAAFRRLDYPTALAARSAGLTDHSTAVHHTRVHHELLGNDAAYRETVATFERILAAAA